MTKLLELFVVPFVVLFFGFFYWLSWLAWTHSAVIFLFLGQVLAGSIMLPILFCVACPLIGLVLVITFWIIAAHMAENS